MKISGPSREKSRSLNLQAMGVVTSFTNEPHYDLINIL